MLVHKEIAAITYIIASLIPLIFCEHSFVGFKKIFSIIIPSIFIGVKIYDVIQYTKLQNNANRFINKLFHSYVAKKQQIIKNTN